MRARGSASLPAAARRAGALKERAPPTRTAPCKSTPHRRSACVDMPHPGREAPCCVASSPACAAASRGARPPPPRGERRHVALSHSQCRALFPQRVAGAALPSRGRAAAAVVRALRPPKPFAASAPWRRARRAPRTVSVLSFSTISSVAADAHTSERRADSDTGRAGCARCGGQKAGQRPGDGRTWAHRRRRNASAGSARGGRAARTRQKTPQRRGAHHLSVSHPLARRASRPGGPQAVREGFNTAGEKSASGGPRRAAARTRDVPRGAPRRPWWAAPRGRTCERRPS